MVNSGLEDFKRIIKGRIVSEYQSLNIPCCSDVFEHLSNCFGSFFRSRLLLLLAGSLGTLDDKKYSLASAIEVLHHATLLHDDVIDSCRHRRNKYSLNAKFGDKVAILAGDVLFGLAGKIIKDCGHDHLYGFIIDTVLKMSSGELTELRVSNTVNMDFNEYIRIIDDKTGSLFGLVFLFATEENKAVKPGYYSKGVIFGRYFQIIDDTKDYMLDFEMNRKPNFNDFRSGILTYPLIMLLNRLDTNERSFVEGRFGKIKNEEEIFRIRKLFFKYSVFSDIYNSSKDALNSIFNEFDSIDMVKFGSIIDEMLDPIKMNLGGVIS